MSDANTSAYLARIEFVAMAHSTESGASTLLGVFNTFAAANLVARQWLLKSGDVFEVSIAECEVNRAYLHDSAPSLKRFALRTQVIEV